MASSHPLLLSRLADWSRTTSACRPVSAWAADPVLARFDSPAAAATAAGAEPEVFHALAARHDEPAVMAALSVLAPSLVGVARRWQRCGMGPDEVADAEASLVAEALELIREHPELGHALMAQKAWHRVAAGLRTSRSRDRRVLPRLDPEPAEADDSMVVLLDALRLAMDAGALTAEGARTIWAAETGWSGPEAAAATGCSAGAWRTRSWRARAALAATFTAAAVG